MNGRMTHTGQAYWRHREVIVNPELEPGRMYPEVDLAEFVGLGARPRVR